MSQSPSLRRPPKAWATLAGLRHGRADYRAASDGGRDSRRVVGRQGLGPFLGLGPKEVWALISLLVYLVILHAASSIGWARDFGMAMAAVLGATAVLFTWYGVNFLLGSGSHAYGAGSGGRWAVGAAVALNWLFLAAAAIRYLADGG